MDVISSLYSDEEENLQVWFSDSKENARFDATNVKNRDLSRRMGKISIPHMPRFPVVHDSLSSRKRSDIRLNPVAGR